MKYRQLENLEAGWKWSYLVKKYKEGEQITRHLDSSESAVAMQLLLSLEHEPTQVLAWIDSHMSHQLDSKLKQAIRAKRKRYYNAEQEHTKKKSIDLDFLVWQKLSERAKALDATLSDTIEYLLSEFRQSSDAANLPLAEPSDGKDILSTTALQKLNDKAKELNVPLSDTIEYLISQDNRSSLSLKQINELKQDLNDLLDL